MSEGLLKKIDITIAGRKFPLKVTQEEEPRARAIEKKLNAQIHDFHLKYADKDKLDCVVMTLIMTAFDIESGENEVAPTLSEESEKTLSDIENILENLPL